MTELNLEEVTEKSSNISSETSSASFFQRLVSYSTSYLRSTSLTSSVSVPTSATNFHAKNSFPLLSSSSASSSPSHLTKPLTGFISSSSNALLRSVQYSNSFITTNTAIQPMLTDVVSSHKLSRLINSIYWNYSPFSFSFSNCFPFPASLYSIIITVSRYPSLHKLCLLPSSSWSPSFDGENKLDCACIPTDHLLDDEVLEEFIWKIKTLGWGEKRVFEEIWMSLLGVVGEGGLIGGVKGLNVLLDRGLVGKKCKRKANAVKEKGNEEEEEDSCKNNDSLGLEMNIFGRCKGSMDSTVRKRLGRERLNEVFLLLKDESNNSYHWSNADVDMDSCVIFLIDLYDQIIASHLPQSPMLLEIYKYVSNLQNHSVATYFFFFADRCTYFHTILKIQVNGNGIWVFF